MGNYRELEIWQRAMNLAVLVYRVTELFPSSERFVLTAQLRRAACSVPANIAEGRGRGSDREFARFLDIGYGSLLETETLVLLCGEVGLATPVQCRMLLDEMGDLGRMINGMKASLRTPRR